MRYSTTKKLCVKLRRACAGDATTNVEKISVASIFYTIEADRKEVLATAAAPLSLSGPFLYDINHALCCTRCCENKTYLHCNQGRTLNVGSACLAVFRLVDSFAKSYFIHS